MRILIDGQTLSAPDLNRGIGRVFLGLCRNMIIRNKSHQWLISVPAGCDPSPLGYEALHHAEIVEVPAVDLTSGYEKATSENRAALEKICLLEEIDVYWCPNPMMLNVVLPIGLSGPRIVCTMFDIIPARLPETHQTDWSAGARDEYAKRLDGIVGWADRLVFISESAANDFAEWAPPAREKSTAILLGVDHCTFWPSAAIVAPPSPSYVLIVAGADPRKNTERAIVAFARLCNDRQTSDDFVSLRIVGAYDAKSEQLLRDVSVAQGISNRVHFLGHVDDTTLGTLYREASALLFPSLYEGFGLPAVEALACGTPVIVSDRDEFHESAGKHGVFCDPTDPIEMAQKLGEVLENPWADRFDRMAAIEWAQNFTWERAADAYGSLLHEVGCPTQHRVAVLERPRVAWASPWPPIRSGIADYSFELVRRLREHMDIEIFTESIEGSPDTFELAIHTIDNFSRMRDRFDIAIYHLGNNSDYHRELYKAAWETPGIVVLHDYNIHPFLHSAYLGTLDEPLYRDALSESHGSAGLHHFGQVKVGDAQPAIWEFSGSRAIADRNITTVVHSAWAYTQLRSMGAKNVSVIPHGASVRPRTSLTAPRKDRAKMGLSPDAFVIGVFGFLNLHKRIPSVIAACKNLYDTGYPITLLLVGELTDERIDLAAEIDRYGSRDFIRTTGFVDDETYWAYLDVTDVLVNLRYPSMGESSGSLMRALGNGTACIVSDHAQFAELPNSIRWKISTDESEIDELTMCLAELLRRPEIRETLGRNARDYIANLSSFDYAASLYRQVVDMASRADHVE